jgi:hypothetical protein
MYKIQCLDLASGQVRELYETHVQAEQQWLGVAPDERWVLFGQVPPAQSELMLVENFR